MTGVLMLFGGIEGSRELWEAHRNSPVPLGVLDPEVQAKITNQTHQLYTNYKSHEFI